MLLYLSRVNVGFSGLNFPKYVLLLGQRVLPTPTTNVARCSRGAERTLTKFERQTAGAGSQGGVH